MSKAERRQLYKQILVATAIIPFVFGRRATEAEATLIDSLLELIQDSDEMLSASDAKPKQLCETL